MSMAMGGTFKDGFIGSAIGAGLSHVMGGMFEKLNGNGIEHFLARTAIATIGGGVGSVLAGGKFADGAFSAAFFHVFNFELHNSMNASAVSKTELGLTVLREFFDPSASNINDLYADMRSSLSSAENALVLFVNSNGEHAGLIFVYMDSAGALNIDLYDPAGSYMHSKAVGRSPGDWFGNTFPEGGKPAVTWSLANYIDHHKPDGSMSFTPIWTTGTSVRGLTLPSNTSGGFCACSVASVLNQIPGIKTSGGWYTPNSVAGDLKSGVGRSFTINH
jgi:hypothetical protein